MRTVIPAAGKGTRLRPLTDDKPKALVEVDGKPMLYHVMDKVLPYTDEFIVVVGYEGEQIINRLGFMYNGVDVKYVKQDEQLGLAHAILQAKSYIDDTFAVALADSFHFGSVREVFESDGAILVEPVPLEEASRYGIVQFEDGLAVHVVEKPENPKSCYALTGLGVFPPEFMQAAEVIQPSDRGEYEWTDVMNLLLTAGFELEVIEMDGPRVDVGYPEDVEEVERLLE